MSRNLLFIVFSFVLSACTSNANKDLLTAKVEKGDVVQRVSLSGEVRANRSTTITMPYSGYVKRLYVKVGQKVKGGDPLVAFSQSLGAGEDAFPVRSSYSAVVSQVLRNEGDYVQDSAKDKAVVRIDDMSKVFVSVEVPESEMAKLKDGMTAQLRVNAVPDQSWTGTLVELFRSAREKENSWDRVGAAFPVRIQISNPDEKLLPGMSATADIISKESKGVLRIPQQYLQKDDQGPFVSVKGSVRRVKTGLRSDDYVEILEGVKEGELVEFNPKPPEAGK